MNRKRVLMVDDEAGFTRMVKITLEKRGPYTVEVVNRPYDALAKALAFKPEIILLDLIMPGMDGGEVASQIESESELRDVPIIFLTATAIRGAASHDGLVSGGYRFLSKPVALEDLVRCMEARLAEKQSAAPSATE